MYNGLYNGQLREYAESHSHTRQYISGSHFISSMSSYNFAQWWWWDGVLYKQTSMICRTKRIRPFAVIINCTLIMKTNFRVSQNVYSISDRIWCNKHLRHTTTQKYENNGKGGYFRFVDDNNICYRYILSFTYTEMGQLNTYNTIYCNENKR